MTHKLKALALALGGGLRAHGVWLACVMAMLFAFVPSAANAQATCTIDFNVAYNQTNLNHVLSMTQNFDETSACDPRFVANQTDPSSGFRPVNQTGTTVNGGSYSTQVNAADNTIVYSAPSGFSGTDTFTLYFCNDSGCTTGNRIVATVLVTVGTPTIDISPTSAPGATVGAAYSQTFTGSGGRAPYGSFVRTSGTLPAGLTLSAAGVLSGTPTASGSFNFTIRTTDSSLGNGPFNGSRNYTLVVAAPTVSVSPTTLPNATVASAYSQTISGAGGTAPYTGFTVSSGALPAGLALNSATGVLSGTPTAGGSFNFTVTTTDSTTGAGPYSGSRAYTLTVAAPTVLVAPASLPAGTQTQAYSQTVTASGGTGPYSFARTAGALPAGLTLSAAGVLSGTPTVNGSFNFTVTTTDSSTGAGPYTGARAYTLVIAAPPAPVANAVSTTVAYNSSTNPIPLNITGGAATSVAVPVLPSHGTVNIVGTAITYTPTAGYGGPDTFTYTATNAGGTSAPATVTLTVSPPTITVAPTTLPGGQAGTAYSQTITAAGGGAPYSYAITAGAQPTGLTLSAGGVLSGTPTTGGTFTFTVTATDSSTGNGPYTGARAYSVTILNPDPAIANPVSATVAFNSSNNPVTLNITGGAPTSVATPGLPSHGTVAIAGTAITYTPTAGYFGSDSFTYTATNAGGTSSPATVSLTVNPQPPIAGAVTATVAQNSGNTPITLNITGGAPVSVSASSVVNGSVAVAGTSISFTPTNGYNGPASFTYTATNAGGTSAPATVSITVTPLPPIAGAVSATVAFGSAGNPIVLNLSGGAAVSVATPTLPTNGTVTVSGTSITYTPATGYAGPDSFTYTATNAGGTSAPAAATITVSPPPAPIAGAVSVTVAASSSANPVTLNLSGGAAVSVATPTLPANGVVSVTGTSITYTPTAGYSGADSFTYTATNLGGTSAPATVTVTVSAPTLTLSAVPTTGQVTAAYSATLTASLGTAPYTYALTAGALPSGLGLTSTGVLSGTATAAGTFNFTVTATDQYGATGARAYAITIAAPTVAITAPAAGALPSVEAFSAYSRTFTATGGVGPRTFAVTAGALPSGLSLSSAGALSGSPTAVGTFNFTVTASDSSAAPGPYASAPVAYSLTVTAPSVVLSPAAGALTPRTTALAFTETFSASGGTGPYSFAVTAGGLPPGIGLTSDGVLAGAPTAAGNFNFTLTATDANGFTASGAYALTVSDPAITVTAPAAGALPGGTAYAAYSQTFTAAGGTGPRTFAVTAGALPAGLALSGGGVLSGTPTTSGTFNFTLVATDSSGAPGPFSSAPAAFSLTIAAPTVTITSPPAGPLTAGTATVAYSQTFTAAGGNGGHSFAVTAGALPPGLSLSSTGVLSGTPTVDGAYAFSIVASDTSTAPGPYASAPVAYSLTIAAPTIEVTPPPGGGGGSDLPEASATTAYNVSLTASGGVAPYSFAVTAGALPPGVTLSSSGLLSGTPTTPGSYTFTVVATDSSTATGPYASAPLVFNLVVDPPVITVTSPAPGALPGAVAFTPVSATFTADGGQGPHTFAVTAGALPPGVSLSSGGVLSGSPSAVGTFTFSVTASDSSSAPGPFASAPAAYSLTVSAPTVAFTPTTIPNGTTGVAYSQTFTATGGTAPYSYALTAGALPAGIALSAGGVLSGAPTTAGTFSFTVTATDANGFAAANAYSLTIADASPVSAADAASTPANQAVSVPVTANDTGVITSIAVITAPANGTAVINGLEVTYTPTADYFGPDSFTYAATGPGGTSAPATVSLTVSPLAVPIAPARTLTVIAGQSGGVDAVAGATGGPITGVAVATAPANGSAVVSGQTLVYTPTAGFTGTDSFTYTLSNAFGTSAPATVTVTVNPAPIAPAPITIEILSGQTATVSLTAAATGGPFTGATLVSLTPPAAGAAAITNPASGQYGLTFTPTTTFAGTVTATYTLTNAFTTSAPGTVTIIVTARPDPSLDPEVTGLIAAQDETARRFASAQISNITSRLEALRDGRGGGASLQLSFSGGSRDLALDTDPLRRRLAGSNGFDTLLVSRQDGAAVIGDNAGSSGGGAPASSGSASGRVGLWAAGGVDFGQRDATIAQQGVEFDTDGLTAGVDVRVRDDLVVGASVGWGHDESRVGNDGTRSDADGHSYAVYGSYQPGARVFVDGVLGYGRLDLDSRRYVAATDGFADGHRDGSQWFGALTAGWDFRDGRRLFSPYGRLSATRSELDAFTETSGGPYALSYEAQTVETLTGALGVRWAWVVPVAFGEVVPRVRLEYGHDFQGADRADVSYADWLGGPTFGVRIDPLSENRILGGFGLDLFTSGGSRFGFDYEAGFSENAEQHRLRLQIQALF